MGSKESCCFTGHRILPAGELPALRAALRREISNLAEAGVGRFLAGGARGFDMLAAQEVLWLREERYALELVLVLPCPEQADRWNARERQAYREMVQEADEVIYVSEVYTPDCMFPAEQKTCRGKRQLHLLSQQRKGRHCLHGEICRKAGFVNCQSGSSPAQFSCSGKDFIYLKLLRNAVSAIFNGEFCRKPQNSLRILQECTLK